MDELPPDADALQQALNEKRGSEVQLYVPQRGDKARLTMAHTNAGGKVWPGRAAAMPGKKAAGRAGPGVAPQSRPAPLRATIFQLGRWHQCSPTMVTFKDGKPYKAGYRKFKMKTVLGTDDYASLAETVSRRAAEYEKYAALAKAGEPSNNPLFRPEAGPAPDGRRPGPGGAARAAGRHRGAGGRPPYGMVKDDHHRTRAIVDSEGREIAINMNTFTFITAIQDETHRFANAYRKQQMHQKSYASTLTEVPGVGPNTAKALMARFKSVSAVREAAIDQLENTPGVGPRLARTIYDHFHRKN